MNIVFLVIDTLRHDCVGENGNSWIHTPNLDELAGRSWVFNRAFASSYPTIPHRTDVITGRYGTPFHPWMPLRFDVPTLPGALAQAGYCTQLIHDTPHLVNGGHAFDWPFHAWTFIRGAEVDRPRIDGEDLTFLPNWKTDPLFDFAGDRKIPNPPDHTLVTYTRANRQRVKDEDWNAAQLFLSAADFLRDNAGRENFFLWIDCFDPHEPWDAPVEYMRMYDDTPGYDGTIDPRAFLGRGGKDASAAVKKRLKAMYSAKVSFVDHWFGEVLQALEETELAANTAIVVTADHGTNVGERDRFGKGWPVYEQEAHVPLIVYVPGRGAGQSDMIVQPQDVTATILGIAGAEKALETDGFDLLRLAEEEKDSPRQVALAGRAAHLWEDDPASILFTVLDEEGYLQWAPSLEHCRLFEYGSPEAVASPDAETVQTLWELGLEEVERRRTDPALLEWLASGGTSEFPAECTAWPGPKDWAVYWQRLYNRW